MIGVNCGPYPTVQALEEDTQWWFLMKQMSFYLAEEVTMHIDITFRLGTMSWRIEACWNFLPMTVIH
jgi:hypothetical protein